MKYIIKYQNL